MQRFTAHFTYTDKTPAPASSYLAAKTTLSKVKVKQAMSNGAVWLHRTNRKRERLRRATKELRNDDRISIYYDEELLSRIPPRAELIEDCKDYSVWYKPSGLLAQGNNFGDHCSLLRQVELHCAPARGVFLVHRLDREASGLMVLAHSSPAAAKLNQLFRDDQIEKRYRLEVSGKFATDSIESTIDLPLDGKPALTRYTVETYTPQTDTSIVSATLVTGRTHQLRRHFAALNHPLIGDPRYGIGNKNLAGLQLVAISLKFTCPLTSRPRSFQLPTNQNLTD